MFKELILAIIFGGLIGFGATGTFIALKKKNVETTNNSTSQISTTPIITQTESQLRVTPTLTATKNSLNIFEPINESVVSSSKLIIKGQTDNSAIIVITTADNSYSVASDSSGNFDTVINLSPGINDIKITSISPNDTENNTQLFVTYTTAKI